MKSRSILFSLGILLFSLSVTQAASGDLDITFGNGGEVITRVPGSNDWATAVAVQTDGKIVAAVHAGSGGNQIQLVRYSPDGTRDPGFGTGGYVIDSVSGFGTVVTAMAIQPDGKIVVAGYYLQSGGCVGAQALVGRYNPDGSIDAAFGQNGKVLYMYETCGPSANNAVALQSNGKIVVAGWRYSFTLRDMVAARLNSDGTFDTTFNGTGFVSLDSPPTNEEANAVAITSNGKIIIGGYTGGSSALTNNAMVTRLNSNGTLDTSFNSPNGSIVVDLSGRDDRINSIAIQPDGKIVAGGFASFIGAVDLPDPRFAILRFNAGGTLDTTFDTDGKVFTNFTTGSDMAEAIALQTNGKIVAVGSAGNGSSSNFAVARYNANGSPDLTFSGDGRLTTDIFTGEDRATAVAIQANGRIVVAGQAFNGTDTDIVLTRYLP